MAEGKSKMENLKCNTLTVPAAALASGGDGGEPAAPAAGAAVEFTATGKVTGVDDAGNATVELQTVNGAPLASETPADDAGPTEDDVRAMAAEADQKSGADSYI